MCAFVLFGCRPRRLFAVTSAHLHAQGCGAIASCVRKVSHIESNVGRKDSSFTGAHTWINHCLKLVHGLDGSEQYILSGHRTLVARQFKFSFSFMPVGDDHATSI